MTYYFWDPVDDNVIEEYDENGDVTDTYAYDANGNQQIVEQPDGALTTAVWDYENQNARVELPNGSRVTMMYNADNRRVRRDV